MNDRQFTIDQLRKDKIIYAIECCAITLNCLLVILFAHLYADPHLRDLLSLAAVIMSLGYVLYMGYSNVLRLRKIQQLEKSPQAAKTTRS
jgi:hypothetical protein